MKELLEVTDTGSGLELQSKEDLFRPKLFTAAPSFCE
jgi:hypothetical protein